MTDKQRIDKQPIDEQRAALMRREFFAAGSLSLGSLALASLSGREAAASGSTSLPSSGLHFPARAKRVIYLFQSGAPSQLDLLDYKPLLNERHGTELPASVRGGQRLTGMSGNQSSLPLVGSP